MVQSNISLHDIMQHVSTHEKNSRNSSKIGFDRELNLGIISGNFDNPEAISQLEKLLEKVKSHLISSRQEYDPDPKRVGIVLIFFAKRGLRQKCFPGISTFPGVPFYRVAL